MPRRAHALQAARAWWVVAVKRVPTWHQYQVWQHSQLIPGGDDAIQCLHVEESIPLWEWWSVGDPHTHDTEFEQYSGARFRRSTSRHYGWQGNQVQQNEDKKSFRNGLLPEGIQSETDPSDGWDRRSAIHHEYSSVFPALPQSLRQTSHQLQDWKLPRILLQKIQATGGRHVIETV